MKKALCLILCFLLMFVLVSCGESGTQSASGEAVQTTQQAETEEGDLKDTVKIVLPLAVIDEKYQNDLDAYCDEYGYLSAKLNKSSQTVTVKMNKFSHELLLVQIGTKVIQAIYEVEESGDFPCDDKIEKVDTENFREVIVDVNREEYEKEGNMCAYIIGQSCLLYQLYTESTDYKCDVVVVDSETNEIIETQTYTDKG